MGRSRLFGAQPGSILSPPPYSAPSPTGPWGSRRVDMTGEGVPRYSRPRESRKQAPNEATPMPLLPSPAEVEATA